eukprot:TRINITY_DN10011_c0_g3_i1.p2 TRINITY_DN10011_c0_g3~~TRINITY_DN10011_c0_g3_i1.p2  ORF type:complete len:152 (+),score=13.45 TRINITY_DN10011_c0_g3_i1:536-991(+)
MVPYLECSSGVDAILSAIRLRYGPFVGKPEAEENAASHESMRIWHYLRVTRDEEGKWSKDQLPLLHSFMLRLEALRMQSQCGRNFQLRIQKARAYEGYLFGSSWEDFSDGKLRLAIKHMNSSKGVLEVMKKDRLRTRQGGTPKRTKLGSCS